MDGLLNLDGIDWENIGPSSKSTGCKGRRSDLFTDLRRPLADVDTNRVADGDTGRADAPRSGARDWSAAAAPAGGGGNEAPSKAARRRSSDSSSRRCRQLDPEAALAGRFDGRADRGGCSSVPAETAAACAMVQEEGPVAPRASPPRLGGGRRSLTFEAPLGLSSEFAGWTADDFDEVCHDASAAGPVAPAVVETPAAQVAACAPSQTKRFADTFSSIAEEIHLAEQTKRRRSSNSSTRRSRLLEPPSAWDLDVSDGILGDFLLPTDEPLSLNRPRRSLRLRRKSLIGAVAPLLPAAEVEERRSSTYECHDLSPADLPVVDDYLKRLESPDSCVAAGYDQAEAGSWGSLSTAGRKSVSPQPAPGHSRPGASPDDCAADWAGQCVLETAFVASPEDHIAAADCSQLGTIAEEESGGGSSGETGERFLCSAGEGESEASAGVQYPAESESNSSAGRPRRRAAAASAAAAAASYQAQQQQPAQKRRRQSKQQQEQQQQQMLPSSASAAAAVDEGRGGDAVDAGLVRLYTNKAYTAPAKRPLETIYEQPAVWRGQEKVMSAARALRSVAFDLPASSKAKLRRQKARQLGWRPLQPDADCGSRLDQRLKDLDEALLRSGCMDDGDSDGCSGLRGPSAPDGKRSAEPMQRRRSSRSDYDALAAIKSLALT